MKLVSSLACCLYSLQREKRWAFWSSLSILDTNLGEMHLMFKLSARMRWTVPYDSHTISQTLWMVCLRSSRRASRSFAMFSGVVFVDGRPERSSSSTDALLSLKDCTIKRFLWLMELSPKAFCSIWCVSATVFFKIETKFDADFLLLKIRHISCKKSPDHKNALNLITRPLSCWHTDSQSMLLAISSGGRAYDNRFGRAV
jgi:hypothetical protein